MGPGFGGAVGVAATDASAAGDEAAAGATIAGAGTDFAGDAVFGAGLASADGRMVFGGLLATVDGGCPTLTEVGGETEPAGVEEAGSGFGASETVIETT